MSVRKKFDEIPEIDKQQLADYFNLENGLYIFDEDDEYCAEIKDQQYKPELFYYLGVYAIDGVETMFWSVECDNVCAIVQPYGESILIGMGDCPNANSKKVS